MTALKNRLKEREYFLKAHNLVRRDVNQSTGEILEELRVPMESGRKLVIRL